MQEIPNYCDFTEQLYQLPSPKELEQLLQASETDQSTVTQKNLRLESLCQLITLELSTCLLAQY